MVKRARLAAGTSNPVSAMPSGSKIRSARKSGSDCPPARGISTPCNVRAGSDSHASPGWYSSGTRASSAIHTSGGGKPATSGPSRCTGNRAWTAGSVKSDAKPYPAREVSRSKTVIGRAAGTTSSTGLAGVRTTIGSASSGSHRATGSSSAIRPSWTRVRTAAATMGLVIEAKRKMASRVIAPPPTAAEPTTATSVRSPPAITATAPGSDPSATKLASTPCRSAISLVHKVEGGADDAVGVEAVVTVQVLDRPGLAELDHAERGVRDTVDGGQEGQRVRVPVQDGHQRGGPGGGEGLVQDPRLAHRGVEPLPGAQGLEDQAGTGDADHVRGRAGRGQPFGRGQRVGHDRAHGRDRDLRPRGAQQRIGARDDLAPAPFPGRGIGGHAGQLLADRPGGQAQGGRGGAPVSPPGPAGAAGPTRCPGRRPARRRRSPAARSRSTAW